MMVPGAGSVAAGRADCGCDCGRGGEWSYCCSGWRRAGGTIYESGLTVSKVSCVGVQEEAVDQTYR